MTIIHRIISLLLLLFLAACGADIQVIVRLPERPTDAATSTIIAAPATNTPTATTSPTSSPNNTNTPTATASPSTTPTIAAGLNATTTANVNFRNAPNTNNVPIRVVQTGTPIRLIGRIADSTWAKVVLADGAEGWMYTQNLAIVGNINSLPIVGTVPTATPTIDPSPTREQRISYNINTQGIPSRTELEAHLVELCPTTLTLMDDFAYAIQIYNLLRDCGTIVIHRDYSILEGDEWFYRSPQSFVDHWKRQGHPEIVRYSTNEPSFGGVRAAQFVATEVELMRLARASGFTVAIGNFSVGIIQAQDINAGLFDPYIRALIQYRHYLALHEYAVVALPYGVGQWQTSLLLDRNNVQPASWPSALALPTRLWNGELPPYWYLRRGDWWLLRADFLGVARPRIILTEFGWDNLPNIKPEIEPLRSRFGIEKYYRDMRGINTYQNLWAYYWPQWSFGRAACEQLKWAMGVYPAEYIGFNLFTWSSNPHWLQTDFSGRENPQLYELQQCLEDYSQN